MAKRGQALRKAGARRRPPKPGGALKQEIAALRRELALALERQTANSDVLKIISRSPVDLGAVLDMVVETVAHLCRADQAYLFRSRDDKHHLVASRGLSSEAREFVLSHPLRPDRGTVSGRAAIERRVIHVDDILQDPDYTYSEGQKIAGFRTMLGIPLLREDVLIGIFSITRTRVQPFTDKEIELATTFADQAVIAIENARLFDELRERTRDLQDKSRQLEIASKHKSQFLANMSHELRTPEGRKNTGHHAVRL